MTPLVKVSNKVRITGAVVLLGAALAAGAWHWNESGKRRTTDNAYVNARVIQVSSLVMGRVTAVPIVQNQYVRKGDVLFEVDRRPFEVAVRETVAKLGQADQTRRQDTSEVTATEADVTRQEAELANAENNLRRAADLVRQNFVSKQSEDDARAKVDTLRAALAQARAKVTKATAALAARGNATPAMQAAAAEVEKATLDLEHTIVRANEDGWIANFNLAAGTVVAPGSPLFAIVVDRSFWIDANFKETELAGIRPGLVAAIVVDMYPDYTLAGEVESLAGSTGSAFSLLPPQNASGNWVKVAQRIPVRIRVTGFDPAHPLRVGATATVTVSLR